MKIVFLDASTLGGVSFEPISALGELTLHLTSTREQALERVKDAEVIIVNKVLADKQLIDAAVKLRLICVAATGVNNVDLDYAAAKGIAVRNAVGYSTESVVQTTFMAMLSLIGKLPYFDNFVKSGEYSKSEIFTEVSNMFWEIQGKTLGIIGLGNIGQRVAKVAQAFGMKVVYFSTSGTSHCKDYPSLPLSELLATADVVTIHAPLNERTKGLIGYEELSQMKPSAYILNMGRGGIINEKALADAIDEGLIAGAAVDVFTKEPLPQDNPMLNIRRKDAVLLFPHIAWASIEARERLVAQIAANIAKGY